jgi:hypothetical protein
MSQIFRQGRIALLACALFLLATGSLLTAQTAVDGAIGGTVFDSTGAVVPPTNQATSAQSTFSPVPTPSPSLLRALIPTSL